jgi:radical SAM superfamily enzyme YgiQ (UPF0313 family)
MPSQPRVLLTTAYRNGPLYDYFGSNIRHTPLRLSGVRPVSPGLHFIKQNVPGVEILDMPTAEQYHSALKRGWDIVGISFYLDETHRALEMVGKAREAGVAQVWGGNYGVLTPEARPHFDRIFTGYSEEEIAQALGARVDSLVHPPLVVPFGMPFLKIVRYGLLFTTRGCSFGCTFCQTPAFAPKPSIIPLESIERVLQCYADHGVTDLIIPDENFGIIPRHAEEVTALMAKHNMLWIAMTRADFLVHNFDQWRSRGLAGVMIGVESLDQQGLNGLQKRSTMDGLRRAVELCRKHGIVMVGFYMIGLESDTEESIRASVAELQTMGFDLVQMCVLTPLPQTPLWRHIEQHYGITTDDYSQFDGKHLVWNHPTLSKQQLEGLLHWSIRVLYPPTNFARSLVKHANSHARRIGRWRTVPYFIGNTLRLNLQPFRQLPFLSNGGELQSPDVKRLSNS